MSKYCLVARNKDNNSFKVLGIKECWYRKNGSEEFVFIGDLAAIDLVTTRFASKEEMAKRLYQSGYIDGENYDFFIASKPSKSSGNSVKIHEVIYRPYKNKRMADFREVAFSECNGSLKNVQDRIGRLFNKFIDNAYYYPDFNYMLTHGFTAIPKRIIDTLEKILEVSKNSPRNFKYQVKWIYDSYPIIRNVVEAINRFDMFVQKGLNVLNANIDYFKSNSEERKLLLPSLEIILDKNYSCEQFDILEDELSKVFSKSDKKEDIVEKVIEEKKVKKTYPIIGDVTDKNMLSKVMDFLTSIPLESFKYVDNKLAFNFEVFDFEVDKDTRKKLNSLLTGNLRNYVRLYLFHKSKFEDASMYGHDKDLLQQDMEADRRDIRRLLEKNETRLKRVYEWCKLYSVCGVMNNELDNNEQYGGDEASKRKR